MSDGCPFVSEEKSGPMNGWVCSLTGSEAPSDIAHAYCNAPKSCEYCPVRGGDNRILNPEALTEDICNAIVSSVSSNVEAGIQYMHYAISSIFEQAAGYGYEYLINGMYDAAMQSVCVPNCSGEYVSAVKTEAEEKRAQQLEENLNAIFENCQPCDLVGETGACGTLHIGSEDFAVLQGNVSSYANDIAAEVDGPVDGTYPKYISPAQRMQQQLGEGYFRYLEYINQSIYDVQSHFEEGCSSTFGSMGALYSVPSGSGPGWDTW